MLHDIMGLALTHFRMSQTWRKWQFYMTGSQRMTTAHMTRMIEQVVCSVRGNLNSIDLDISKVRASIIRTLLGGRTKEKDTCVLMAICVLCICFVDLEKAYNYVCCALCPI